jgi:hypothetical protein
MGENSFADAYDSDLYGISHRADFVALYYSMTDYSGIGKATFAGWKNYKLMFSDKLFLIALKDTASCSRLHRIALRAFVRCCTFAEQRFSRRGDRESDRIRAVCDSPDFSRHYLELYAEPELWFGRFDSSFSRARCVGVEWIGGTKCRRSRMPSFSLGRFGLPCDHFFSQG